jgi:hypothetical protein
MLKNARNAPLTEDFGLWAPAKVSRACRVANAFSPRFLALEILNLEPSSGEICWLTRAEWFRILCSRNIILHFYETVFIVVV